MRKNSFGENVIAYVIEEEYRKFYLGVGKSLNPDTLEKASVN